MDGRSVWVVHVLISAAGFAVMAALVRHLSLTLPRAELVFFRNGMALLFLIPVLLRQRVGLRTGRFCLHLLRAVAGLAAMYLYFYALARLPLADALLLNYTAPLFVAVLAVVWLGERWTRRRLGACLLGLLGLLLLFRPSARLFSAAGFLGLGSGLLAGVALTTVKRMAAVEPGIRIVVWFALLATVLSALPLLAGSFVLPAPRQWPWLLAMGLAGSLGQLGVTLAYGRAPATRVSPLSYVSLVFAAILGFVFWGEVPDVAGLAGTGLIVAGGILVGTERDGAAIANPLIPSGVPPPRRTWRGG